MQDRRHHFDTFDTSDSDEARTAHLGGEIPQALAQIGPELQAPDPDIRTIDLIAVQVTLTVDRSDDQATGDRHHLHPPADARPGHGPDRDTGKRGRAAPAVRHGARMMADAVQMYGEALINGEPLHWVSHDGQPTALDIARWRDDADSVDRSVTDRCTGPVLDIGCGPGRILAELAGRGVPAAGVDVSPHAVELARRSGATALCLDVFGPLPGEGTWSSAVLLDGNIGIGGDPTRLLERVHDLVADGGVVFVETHQDPAVDKRLDVWLTTESQRSRGQFAWALVGERAVRRHAKLVGFSAEPAWTLGGRSFVRLVKPVDSLRPAVAS